MTDTQPLIRTLRHDTSDRPFIVIWEVTRACDLVCQHCRADAIRERNPFELTTAEGRRLLDELASLGVPRPLVVLTGGDPFERPDLEELVAHGTAQGLSMSLSPSVTPRLTRPTMQRLRDAGAKAVSLSLDGANAATHDGFRGVDGVFDATLDATHLIRELGLRLQINTTVTRHTIVELPDVLRQVMAMDAFLWSVFFLVPTGRGEYLDALDADETEDVLHWLHDVSRLVAIKTTEAPHFRRVALQRTGSAERTGLGVLYDQLRTASADLLAPERVPERRVPRPPLHINAGNGFVFVDHLGAVYPSGFLPIPVGSVRDRPITEIYRDSPLLRALREPATFGGRCGHCEFRDVCGGSRSRAYATTGDPLAEEPTCNHQPAAFLASNA
ncbi:MAG: TIGR04053 family radical SAM/SPASM domain-containing protein [Nitriliruptoraceae bacterium]